MGEGGLGLGDARYLRLGGGKIKYIKTGFYGEKSK